MKSSLYFIGASFFFVLFSVTVLNSAILRAKGWNSLKALVYLFNVPDDYGKPLVESFIDLADEELVKEYRFVNKYPGRYEVGIDFKTRSQDSEIYYQDRYKFNGKIEIEFYSDHKPIFKGNSQDYSVFSLAGGNIDGFFFFVYKCPQDMPLNKIIICRLSITECDKNFQKSYDPIRFFIKKRFDH